MAVARIPRGRVTSVGSALEAWANAAKYYDTGQLAALVCTIAMINTYNRLNVITRNQGGDYQPGPWG
jgi:hypothetical protein